MHDDGIGRQDAAERAQRIAATVADFLRRLAAGEAVDDAALIAASPELTPELGAELRKARLVAAAVHRADPSDVLLTETHHRRNSDTDARRLEVRCPSCHTPIEVAVDTQLTDLTCSSCGSHFSLVDQSQATRMAPSLSKLGRFDLIERIGIGGFGSVWKARDKELDRTVAVKVPRQGGMTPEEQEKFFREARAAAQLRHPSIVSVHEVGRDGESIYIVSDFVRGVTLGDWLTGQQPTSREAAELCAKIADALHHAHEKGVIHRDLKPANIMIDGDGQPHLMDFGLARREVGEVTVTMDGQALGTPAYMSPEQAKGESHAADRRSDVYSLGVILFQILTGELPFRGNARMLMHQVINDEPPSPRKLNGNVPKDLETITLKCLEKEPSRRYQSAEDLAGEFRRYLSGEPISARPIRQTELAWRWCKRNRAIAAMAAALMLILATISVVAPIVAVQQSVMRKEAQDQRMAAQALLAASLVERAVTECNAKQISNGVTLLASAFDLMRPDDHLRGSVLNLMAMWSPRIGRLMVHDDKVRDVAISPDGRIVATVMREKQVQLWDSQTLKPLGKPLLADDTARAVAFSPDGNLVATGGADKLVRLWDARTRSPVGAVMQHRYKINDLNFSRSGKILASASGDDTLGGEVSLWDTQTCKPVGPVIKGSQVFWSAAFSPDENQLVTGSADRTARLWNAHTGRELGRPIEHKGWVSATFCPSGNTILTANDDGTTQQWDADSHNEVGEPMRNAGGWISMAEYSRDGQLIVTGNWDHTARVWDAKTGRPFVDPLQHEGAVRAVTFGPNDKSLLTGSEDCTARLFDRDMILPMVVHIASASNATLAPDRRHVAFVVKVAFSPDGRRVLTVCRDGTVRLWRADTGEAIDDPIRDSTWIVAATFSPDGRTLLTGNFDGSARLWDGETGRALDDQMRPKSILGTLIDVAFLSEARPIAATKRGFGVQLRDVRSGKVLGELARPGHRDSVWAWGASPESTLFITGSSDLTARTWSSETLLPIGRPMKHNGYVRSVVFSPNGRSVLTGSDDQTAQLWDARTGLPLGQRVRHDDKILCVAFHPNGLAVATGSADGTARMWDSLTGKPLCQPMQHDGPVQAVAFSADGRRFATGSGDKVGGELRIWQLPPPLPDNPAIIRQWAMARTGMTVDEKGAIRRLSQADWLKAQDELKNLRGDLEMP